MQNAILQGVLMGLVLSTFCGPIFFMLINLGVTSSLKSVFYLAFGTFLSDLLIIFLLFYLFLGSVTDINQIGVLRYVGGGVLIYFGMRNLLNTPVIEQQTEISKKELNRIFLKGFMINSFNPNILFFWFGTMVAAFSTYNNNKHFVLIHFISGLSVSFMTDCLKGFSAFHLKRFIKPMFLKVLNKISGLIIIGFGLKLIFFY